jgi:hypothetical protein
LACDRAAASAFAKFRKALSTIVTSEDKDTRSFFFSEYLTWKELIHTSYFNAPRFRLLVAYAIAHSPGFRPSAALTSHPDYELVARWYEEMRPRGAVGAEDGKPQWRPELILAEPRQPSPA